ALQATASAATSHERPSGLLPPGSTASSHAARLRPASSETTKAEAIRAVRKVSMAFEWDVPRRARIDHGPRRSARRHLPVRPSALRFAALELVMSARLQARRQ